MKKVVLFLTLLFTAGALKALEKCAAQTENIPSFFPLTLGMFPEQKMSEKERDEKFLVEEFLKRNPKAQDTFLFKNKSWIIHSIEKEKNKTIILLAPEFDKSISPLKIVYSPQEFSVTEIEKLPELPPTWQQTYYPWLRKALIAIGLIALYKLYYSFQEPGTPAK